MLGFSVVLGISALLPLGPVKIVTSSPEAFTASALPVLKAELQKRGASAAVRSDEALALAVHGADGQDLRLSLERLWALCQREPASCQAETEQYLSRSAEALAMSLKGEPPPDAKQLRLVVRDTKYLQAIKNARPDLIARSAGGSLWFVPLLDFPTSARSVSQADLTKLKLTAAAVEAIGLANVKKEIGPLEKLVQRLPERGIGYLTPAAYYNSGLLAAVADWAPLAKTMKGKLLVSVPTDEVVLYVDSSKTEDVIAFTAITQKMYSEANRPVSTQLLQWSEAGWKPFTP